MDRSAIWAASITAFGAIVAASIAVGGDVLGDATQGPSGKGGQARTHCGRLVEGYDDLLARDPSLLIALTSPGTDGTAPIDADKEAKACGIDAATLESLAE